MTTKDPWWYDESLKRERDDFGIGSGMTGIPTLPRDATADDKLLRRLCVAVELWRRVDFLIVEGQVVRDSGAPVRSDFTGSRRRSEYQAAVRQRRRGEDASFRFWCEMLKSQHKLAECMRREHEGRKPLKPPRADVLSERETASLLLGMIEAQLGDVKKLMSQYLRQRAADGIRIGRSHLATEASN